MMMNKLHGAILAYKVFGFVVAPCLELQRVLTQHSYQQDLRR